jgi:hypothetical protein
LTGLDYSVSQIKAKIVSCHTADSETSKQEVNGTVTLPPLVLHRETILSLRFIKTRNLGVAILLSVSISIETFLSFQIACTCNSEKTCNVFSPMFTPLYMSNCTIYLGMFDLSIKTW